MHLARKVELAKQYIDLIGADESPAEEVKAAMAEITAHTKACLAASAERRAAAAAAATADAQKLAE